MPKRYVSVEWGFALLDHFLAITLPIDSFLYLILLNIIMVIALLTDSEAMVLHLLPLLAGIIAGIAAPFIISSWPVALADSVIGALVGAGLIIITNAVYRISRGRNGFGQGDIWLLAMIGAAFSASGAIIFFWCVFHWRGHGNHINFGKKSRFWQQITLWFIPKCCVSALPRPQYVVNLRTI